MGRSAGEPERPAGARAYELIRRDIVTGALAEGERLTEQRLAERTGLSRTPVRDAIRRLEHEGFVERGQGYSTRVARFPEDELDQIFQIRERLESYAARRAAEMASREQIANLRALADLMSQHTPPRTPEAFEILSRANEDFHRTIHDAARSPRLSALLSMALDVGVVARTYKAYDERDLKRSARHHHEIADAIAARAPDWAASVMASHILAAQAVARAAAKAET
ncbi:MAG: GntR family transcriptional regulator [Pseudomonadota bacterium]